LREKPKTSNNIITTYQYCHVFHAWRLCFQWQRCRQNILYKVWVLWR